MTDLIKQLVDRWVDQTLVGGRKTGDMVVDGVTATEIEQFKTLLAAKLRSPGGSNGGVQTVVQGTGITVNSADAANPIVNSNMYLDPDSPQSVTKIWSGSQAEYDGLTPDSETLYFIVP